MGLKEKAADILETHPRLRIQVRKSVYNRREKTYWHRYKKLPVDPKKILLESFAGRHYSDNPRAIYEYMLQNEKYRDFTFVWALREPEKAAEFPQLSCRTRIVKYLSEEYFREAATAGYLITNSELDLRIRKKTSQIFLQTWHGTPMKLLRCDIQTSGDEMLTAEEIRYKNRRDISRFDYLLSSSAFCHEIFRRGFDLAALNKDEILIDTGFPRIDRLFHYTEQDVQDIRNKIGIPDGKKVILYAPTYRDNVRTRQGSGYIYDPHLDFQRLRQELGDDYVILFRAHYFIANHFDFHKFRGFVYDVTDKEDIEDLYIISDLLITDYSSVLYDYANLGRPMVFYMYDLPDYRDEIRGFYLSLDEFPGEIARTAEELIHAIREPKDVSEKYKTFQKKFNPLDDGEAAKRVTERIIG